MNGLNVARNWRLMFRFIRGCRNHYASTIGFDNIHGETGLDGRYSSRLTRQAESTHAVKYIIDTLMASDGDIALVPVGPLSNIAVGMRMQPRSSPKSVKLC
ncbi:nucleoside hydrolase [Shigella flexneri]